MLILWLPGVLPGGAPPRRLLRATPTIPLPMIASRGGGLQIAIAPWLILPLAAEAPFRPGKPSLADHQAVREPGPSQIPGPVPGAIRAHAEGGSPCR